jgi:hypothetical protein
MKIKDSLSLTPNWEEKYGLLCVTEITHVFRRIRRKRGWNI